MKTSFFTDRQHLTEEGVALYVDGLRLERTAELPDEMRLHVEGCAECQLQIVEAHELIKRMPYSSAQLHPYFDRTVKEPAIRYTAYSIAAVIGAAAILAAGYFILINNNNEPPSVVQKNSPSHQNLTMKPESTTIEKKESTSLLADNFSVSTNLEGMVNGDFRSFSIEVLSPAVGATVHTPIQFKWKTIDESLTINILTNQEKTIISSPVKGNSFTVKNELGQGLYYWKLETKDEMVYVGKFFVK